MAEIRDCKRLERIIAAALIVLMCAAAFPVFGGGTSHADSIIAAGRINKSVSMKKKCSSSSKNVKKLKKNTAVYVNYEVNTSKKSAAASNRWYNVSVGGKTGFVKANRVGITIWAGVPGYTVAAVNYRSGPGTTFKKLGTANSGTAVTILLPSKRPGGAIWYKVLVNGRTAYMHSKYVSLGTPESRIETGISSGFQEQFSNVVNKITNNPGALLSQTATSGGQSRVVYTFDTKNCTKLFAVTGDGETQVPQGFTFTGSEYYVLFGMNNSQCIITYDANGKRKSVYRFPENLGHLNGISWDPQTGLCYIFKGNQQEIYTWNPATNQPGIATTKYSSSGVGYDNVTNKLYASSTSCIRVYSADGNFTYDGLIYRCKPGIEHSVQDCGAGNGYIFHGITSKSDRFLNYLDVYRASDRMYLGSIKVTIDEIESIVVGNDGYIQLLINNNTRTDYVWKTPLNVYDLH